VHGRAEEIIVIRYRLARVNAYPHPEIFGRFSVVRRKAPLNVGSGAYRIGDLIEHGHIPSPVCFTSRP
jgi:hypothetical protein